MRNCDIGVRWGAGFRSDRRRRGDQGRRTRFQFGDFASNTLSFLKGEFAAEYRRAITVKTAEAMKRKAQCGHVTGGRVFGYQNVKVDKHVERRIEDAEAAVVRLIFDLCAKGAGYARIAKMLNAESAACPRPQQGRPWGWAPSTVRDVLHRDLYRVSSCGTKPESAMSPATSSPGDDPPLNGCGPSGRTCAS